MAASAEIIKQRSPRRYQYTALNKKGKVVNGSIKATNEAFAGNMLITRGLKPVSIALQPPWHSLDQMFPSLFSIKPQEIISFSRQLASLLEGGIPLLSALESVRQQAESRPFRRVLNQIVKDVSSGISLSEALLKQPKVFNEIYCKTIRAAENTGDLHTILLQVADYQEKQGTTVKKFKKALAYPATILIVGVVVVVILMTTALPQMIEMFKVMDVDLPIATRILIAMTNFITNYKLYLFVFVIFLAVLGVWFFKRPSGRLKLDQFLLSAPIIGPPMHAAELARFSRTAQVLLTAGLSLQDVMELVPQTSGNMAMKQALERVNRELIMGRGITEPMRKEKLFPRLLTQMLMAGEESNNLAYAFGVVAKFYEGYSDDKITSMLGRLTPMITMFVAGMVGFIALAVVMPMYQITQAFD
ncbi:type II secretion system F family protein [Chloroflexota bacterium]